MKYYFLLLLGILPIQEKCLSQSLYYDKYNEGLWKIIDFATQNETPIASDTMVVISTIRNLTIGPNKIFNNEINSENNITNILAIYRNNRWKLFLMNSIDEAASYLPPKKDIVVYVEGMGKTFTTNLYRSAGLSVQYNVNVILFDYPSAKPSYSTIQNFKFAKENSIKSAPLFSIFLNSLLTSSITKKEWIADKNVTFLHHSMGNRILENLLSNTTSKNLMKNIFNTLILNAPCVNQKNHIKWVDSLVYTKNIIINYNSHDRVLKGATFLTMRKQLGSKIKNPLSKKVIYVNLHEAIGNQHSLFLNRPGISKIPENVHQYYYKLFHEENIDWNDTQLFSPNVKKKGYTLSKENSTSLPK